MIQRKFYYLILHKLMTIRLKLFPFRKRCVRNVNYLIMYPSGWHIDMGKCWKYLENFRINWRTGELIVANFQYTNKTKSIDIRFSLKILMKLTFNKKIVWLMKPVLGNHFKCIKLPWCKILDFLLNIKSLWCCLS